MAMVAATAAELAIFGVFGIGVVVVYWYIGLVAYFGHFWRGAVLVVLRGAGGGGFVGGCAVACRLLEK